MEIEYGGINKRYDLFWEGMAFEKENNLQKAIETYIAYADSLAFLDKHIPHYWISDLYDRLDQPLQAIHHLDFYAKGCSKLKAAEIYKEIGIRYYKLSEFEKAIHSFELALSYDENVSVKKLIDNAKNKLYGKC